MKERIKKMMIEFGVSKKDLARITDIPTEISGRSFRKTTPIRTYEILQTLELPFEWENYY